MIRKIKKGKIGVIFSRASKRNCNDNPDHKASETGQECKYKADHHSRLKTRPKVIY